MGTEDGRSVKVTARTKFRHEYVTPGARLCYRVRATRARTRRPPGLRSAA